MTLVIFTEKGSPEVDGLKLRNKLDFFVRVDTLPKVRGGLE